MLKEIIILDWYKDFGIEVYDSDCAYEEVATITGELNQRENGFWKNHTKGIKRFEHQEYAFKFSSHELDFVDVKTVLERLEKIFILEEWTGVLNCHIKFNGKLQVFSLKDIDKFLLSRTRNTLNEVINTASLHTIIQRKKGRNNERPIFFRRIPWELRIKSKPLWYPDTGYTEIYDFETMKKRKPTTDEIVNNASLYTRFSTGFV